MKLERLNPDVETIKIVSEISAIMGVAVDRVLCENDFELLFVFEKSAGNPEIIFHSEKMWVTWYDDNLIDCDCSITAVQDKALSGSLPLRLIRVDLGESC